MTDSAIIYESNIDGRHIILCQDGNVWARSGGEKIALTDEEKMGLGIFFKTYPAIVSAWPVVNRRPI